MKSTKREIAAFYDAYVPKQQAIGINLRMYTLYKRMLNLGLKSNDQVLELGCGIGSITRLLGQKVKKGKIESVDISDTSIQYARQRIQRKNIRFICADVTLYQPTYAGVPKWVTLFDLIEHIPLSRHQTLFENIDSYLPAQGKVLINIPAPEHIEYDRKENPDVLQIIDQPIYLQELQENLKDTDLQITHFEVYNLWQPRDYNFIVLEKKHPFTPIPLSFSWRRKLEALRLKWVNLKH